MIRLLGIALRRRHPVVLAVLCDGEHVPVFVTPLDVSRRIKGPRDVKVSVILGEADRHIFEAELSLFELRALAQRAEDQAAPLLASYGLEGV
jgi:hypothetical protein